MQNALDANFGIGPLVSHFSQALPEVLDRIDADLEKSLGRLFDFLKIPSISTDPAHKQSCQDAARFIAGDLSGLGFDVDICPTRGHPVVLAKSSAEHGKRR